MENLLARSAVPGIWVIAALNLLLIVLSVRKYRKNGSSVLLLTALITAGLLVDSFLIGLGAFVDISLLKGISRIRFISHGVLIPLVFPICSLVLDLRKPFSTAVYVLTAVMMALGFAEAVCTSLDVVTIAGISRMAAVKDLTPLWAQTVTNILNFGTVIPLMICGLVVWFRKKTPCVFLSGLLMFVFSALGPATGNTGYIFYISMYGEVLMIAFLYLYGRKH